MLMFDKQTNRHRGKYSVCALCSLIFYIFIVVYSNVCLSIRRHLCFSHTKWKFLLFYLNKIRYFSLKFTHTLVNGSAVLWCARRNQQADAPRFISASFSLHTHTHTIRRARPRRALTISLVALAYCHTDARAA